MWILYGDLCHIGGIHGIGFHRFLISQNGKIKRSSNNCNCWCFPFYIFQIVKYTWSVVYKLKNNLIFNTSRWVSYILQGLCWWYGMCNLIHYNEIVFAEDPFITGHYRVALSHIIYLWNPCRVYITNLGP